MPRPPASDPRTKIVMVRLTEAEYAKLDLLRKGASRSAFIRSHIPFGK